MQRDQLKGMPKNLMFALDIGTRSVVGVISKRVDDQYHIVDHEVMAHPERAMFDGQIHDIQKVTQVVQKVVAILEERNGFKLEQAAIAAAGRALKTERARVELNIDVTREIDKTLTDNIEMTAIQTAQQQLLEEGESVADYYCVGYSVIQHGLDGAMILNPIGHRGRVLSVEVIATFLPHIVVDSLYSVVQRAGLEVMNLTLEPIAAINVAIPKNLRLLNLALVDVGAGTSDIAISKDGSVLSYGMVALAGDEITEKIAQTYLIDFNTAEKLKIDLASGPTHVFKDVLGIEQTVSSEEVLNVIEDTTKKITQKVADALLELNKKAPSAIFCIGGGSQIPHFTEFLADAVGLAKERVAIKAVEALEKISFCDKPLVGPEFITPVGIGVTAFEERDQDFIQVTVNETTIRMFHSKPLQVSDALVLTGFSARRLISERGEDTLCTIDGVDRKFKGDYGEPAKIYVNGKLSSLDTKIGHKDHIVIVSAEPGKRRRLTLKDLVLYDSKVTINDAEVNMVQYVIVNGVDRTSDYVVCEGDQIETVGVKTIEDLANVSEIDLAAFDILLDGERLFKSDRLIQGASYKTASVMASEPENPDSEPVKDKATYEAVLNLVVNGKSMALPKTKNEMVFVDVFDHIAFDLSKPQGILNLKLNGERARYTDVLRTGDVIDINWKK